MLQYQSPRVAVAGLLEDQQQGFLIRRGRASSVRQDMAFQGSIGEHT